MKTRHFLLVFVGICLVFAGIVTAIGAYEYEVKKVDTVDGQAPELEEFIDYERLDGQQKEIVDRALAGEAVAVREADDLPGHREKQGKLGVAKDGTYHILTRRMFFNWRTDFGLASLALWAAGLAAISEGVRRSQFSHRPFYWVRV
ncbi:hypothetical protein BRC82_04315 [Halobacteriales archaeon QS_1_67_19]|nr:MAG: hypothetical protein BRC82_04315 [Halobacteriales archaeon QS_1_67_19]